MPDFSREGGKRNKKAKRRVEAMSSRRKWLALLFVVLLICAGCGRRAEKEAEGFRCRLGSASSTP